MSKKKQPDDTPLFEASISRLQSIVEAIEKDGTSLEDSLKLFEEGVNLTRQVQVSLSEAEQKVRTLIESENELVSADFESSDD